VALARAFFDPDGIEPETVPVPGQHLREEYSMEPESNDPTQQSPQAAPAAAAAQPEPGLAPGSSTGGGSMGGGSMGSGPIGAGPMNNWPSGARMPILGNAEWAMWLLVEIIFAIVWATSDAVDGGAFAQLTAITTFAYLISRGIAKAGRVLER
jgi:hypothetical protein